MEFGARDGRSDVGGVQHRHQASLTLAALASSSSIPLNH